MRRTFILLFLCFTTLLMAQRTDRIQEALSNYDYETVLSLIDKEKPTLPLLLQKGKALRGLGLNKEALAAFQEVIANDTTHTNALIEAAECCRTLAKYQQALKYYEQALDRSPENKYVRIQYIGLLLAQQKFQEALGESSLMTEKDSSSIALHLQAQSFEGMGSLLPAMGCYYNIQEKYADDYLAAAKLGALNIAASDYDEAILTTEKYRQTDTTNITVNRQNALAYCLKKDYPTAINRYEYLVSQGDSSFHTCLYLGISYYAEEEFYKVRDMLEAARKHEPDNVNLLYYLGRACAKTSWKKQGTEYLERAIDLSLPKDSNMLRLYKGMADCYKLAQMHNERIETIQLLYNKYDKNNPKYLYELAAIYKWQLRDDKNAEQYVRKFLDTRPKTPQPEQAKMNEKGELELGLQNYYNAAEKWMEDIKKEKFFIGGSTKEP